MVKELPSRIDVHAPSRSATWAWLVWKPSTEVQVQVQAASGWA